ncbi:hypothetical protein BPAE_0142g00280 [Botrytis paeoniae]|uniref:Uncharacterized protein n=1 Tax=Botrytis paeoniae TaxID=278948 RepID=A0A4Z1FFJ4_9HELO|nr:hypothetical protein BPAE_0142g00280 [Botrytis paeoniae]
MDNDGIIRNYNLNHFLTPLIDVPTAAEEDTNTDILFTSLVKHIPLQQTSRDELKRAKPIADLSWHNEAGYAMTADDFFDRAPSTNSCLISASQKKSSDSLNIGNGKKLDTFTCSSGLPP